MAQHPGVFGTPDFFREALEEDPTLAFFGALGLSPFAQSPGRRRVLAGQETNIFNQFLSQIGGDLFGGQLPTQSFPDFLQQPDFFRQQFFGLSPQQRGQGGISQFAPTTQFLPF
jgi:hypothetical protein